MIKVESSLQKEQPKWKRSLIIWVAIYPTITLISWLFEDYLESMPLMLKTFLLTIILVPMMVYLLIPLVTKLFSAIR
ncbi:hypothetical protein [uncultured Aquimarina sp.]|uniref:hypothetical protein n=1 Tax=uncultured Aquimarina sp. TaxID=575652 RepID=UPI002627DA8C|nr:hypothetical protein [uncultured Aquimarina sp.]